jgi:hypothetical protein
MPSWSRSARSLLILIFIAALATAAQAANDTPNNNDCVAPRGVQQAMSQFTVTKSDDGYVLLLPPGMLKQLPDKAEYKIALTATNGQSSAVTGVGMKDGENFLNIATSQSFNLPTINRNALKALDLSIVQGEGLTNGGCEPACPHSKEATECYEVDPTTSDCTICWCLSTKKKE